MYSSMARGISPADATSNSKKIKPVALAIVELHVGMAHEVNSPKNQPQFS